MIGVDGAQRQRLILDRQREDLIEWAKSLGLGADIIEQINERFQAAIGNLAEGTKKSRSFVGRFLKPQQLFRAIQSQVSSAEAGRKAADDHAAKATAENTKQTAAAVQRSNDLLSTITRGVPAVFT